LAGSIENLVYDDKSHRLLNPLEVRIVNISKSGLRILARENDLHKENVFQINVKIGENDKLLTGRVANERIVAPGYLEYGCLLGSGKDGEPNEPR
jgi:hypothetical protein